MKVSTEKCVQKKLEEKNKKAMFLQDGGFELAITSLQNASQIVVVCFGTMAIPGDSLGPMVGSILKDKFNVSAFVYGTEQKNVNGKNMTEWLDFLREVHRGATFVAVDASLGKRENVGSIQIRADGVCPAAVNGKKTRFGDVGILAVVGENEGDALMQLMCVSTLYVQELAHKVAVCVKDVISQTL